MIFKLLKMDGGIPYDVVFNEFIKGKFTEDSKSMGFGTFEELFEMATWSQLGLHRNPTAILNVDGYYDHLIAQMEHMVHEGLLKKEHYETLVIDTDIDILLNRMSTYTPPKLEQWLTEKTT